MTTFDFLKVFIACVGFGAAGELIRRYRRFKERRRQIPLNIRNAGFWTDSRLGHAELIFVCFWAAQPFAAIVPLLAADRESWWLWSYGAIMAYSLLVYFIMVALNRREPQ